MADVKELKVEEIKLSGTNPRTFVNPQKLEDLTKSIKAKGVIEPVIVREVKGSYVMVCGERRLTAAKKAGLKTIPALIRELTDHEAIEFQVIENLQREDMNPIDEAAGFKLLQDKFEHPAADIAQRIGKSVAYVNTRIRLLGLADKMKKDIAQDVLTINHGLLLLRIADEEERDDAYAEIKAGGWTAQQASEELDYKFGMRLNEAPFDKTECSKCPDNGDKQGKLFPNDQTNLKGRCFKKECYEKKTEETYQQLVDKLKKEGHEVVTAAPETGTRLTGYENFKKRLGKQYKEKCQKCEHLKHALLQEYGSGPRKHEIYCMNAKCLRKLLGIRAGEGDSNIKRDSTTMIQQRKKEKVREAKRAFWIEKILAARSARGRNAMVLNMLLENIPGHQQGRVTGLKGDRDGYIEWTVKMLYDLGDKKVEAAIVKAINVKASFLDDKDLEFLAADVGVTIKKNFVITKPYLDAKVKADLVKLAKEIGLDKFVAKDKKVPALDECKKGELIDLFLKKGFKLAGKVPKEVQGK